MTKYSTQSGRTMIEMIGVIGIMGVLSVGSIALYDKAIQKYRVNQAIDQITTIAANLGNLRMRQGNFKGIEKDKPEVLQKLKIVPDDLVSVKENGKTKLISAYNGEVYIGTAKSFSSSAKISDDKNVIISYQGLTKNACMALATKDWGKNRTGVIASSSAAEAVNLIKSLTDKKVVNCNETATKGGVACYNMNMTVEQATNGCNCTTTSADGVTSSSATCTFSLWLLY